MRQLRGLEKICRLYGRMKCGDIMMVWDYVNEIAIPEPEMARGSERFKASERERLRKFKKEAVEFKEKD